MPDCFLEPLSQPLLLGGEAGIANRVIALRMTKYTGKRRPPFMFGAPDITGARHKAIRFARGEVKGRLRARRYPLRSHLLQAITGQSFPIDPDPVRLE